MFTHWSCQAIVNLTVKSTATAVTFISISELVAANFTQLGDWSRYTQCSKVGKMDNWSNYRRMGILSALSKILEKHVHIHLYEFLTTAASLG